MNSKDPAPAGAAAGKKTSTAGDGWDMVLLGMRRDEDRPVVCMYRGPLLSELDSDCLEQLIHCTARLAAVLITELDRRRGGAQSTEV